MPMPIVAEMQVEDLVREWPRAAPFLQGEFGIRCLQCGEPMWGTLRDIIEAKRVDVATVIAALHRHLGLATDQTPT